ncbi:MAG: calcium/sodium antiporter [Patescibacteria group bacterium]
MTYVLLIVGFALLIKGADWLVNGASSVATKFKISNLVIGLTIVAFGTSMPELFVNLFASFQDKADIAIGNVVGSNLVNTLLILGVAAVIYPLKVVRGTVWKEIPMSLLAGVMVFVLANDGLINGGDVNVLSRIDGIILMIFFGFFGLYLFDLSKTQVIHQEQIEPKQYPVSRSAALVLIGIVSLVLGGQMIVQSASEIAVTFGLSQALIGLTIVAVGTSLPELATSAVAAYKKNADIAVGNVVGSNIFNVFWVLGLSAVIRPVPFQASLNWDVGLVIAASLLLFIAMFVGKKYILQRWQGVLLILAYVAYIVMVVMRG